MSECRQPYLLSNLDLVTASLTLMRERAGHHRAHLVETVHAGRRLFGDSDDAARHWLEDLLTAVTILFRGRGSRDTPRIRTLGRGHEPARSNSSPLCTSSVASPPSSRIIVGPSKPASEGVVRCTTSTLRATRPSRRIPVHRRVGPSCREIRRRPRRRRGLGSRRCCNSPNARPHPVRRGLDQNGGLDGHVQRSRDSRTLEGFGGTEFGPHRHESWHLVFGQGNLRSTEVGEGQVSDLKSKLQRS